MKKMAYFIMKKVCPLYNEKIAHSIMGKKSLYIIKNQNVSLRDLPVR